MRFAFVGLLLIASSCVPVIAQEAVAPSIFDAPRLHAVSRLMMANGDHPAAENLLRQYATLVPFDYNARYNLACVLAQQGKTDAAFDSLMKSIELGFRHHQHIAVDNDLKSLREDERFAAAIAAARKPFNPKDGDPKAEQPAKPSDGQVVVSDKNVIWSPRLGMFQVFVEFADEADKEKPVVAGLGAAGDLLRQWREEQTVAGNHGDLYDNHDSDHSNMNFRAFPQLTRVEYSEAVKKQRLHHGLQRYFLFNAVTLGNSSTAMTSGPFWRSQGRLALTQVGGGQRLYLHYRSNHLYFYPEHRDHDPGHNGADGKGHGDVFPANTPYLILSQGSSGSDRAFMNAAAQTLAAFRPAVKRKLAKNGLLMPTLQMIFRSSNTMLESPADYLKGKAHPTVFDGKKLDVLKMVKFAHQMRPESLPPLVQLEVTEEDESVLGRDYFAASPGEHIFDTPCAIARVVRSTKYSRRMVVSAEGSVDLDNKPLKFHWVVLRGDAERIRIKKRNEEGSIAELVVPYHSRRPIDGASGIASSRVDIGVFAFNGEYYSAPSFITFYYPDGEKREYDKQNRIRVVDHVDAEVRNNYVDPLITLRKDWRDEYRYNDKGERLGWTRIRGKDKQEFTAEGRLILERDEQGRPLKTAEVRYLAQARRGKAPLLKQAVVESGAVESGAVESGAEEGRRDSE